MKQSKLLIPTLRETSVDVEAVSHQLLLRAGFIRQISNGIYVYLPLAYRVIEKIKSIIREEFDHLDGIELMMPSLIPKDLWTQVEDLELYHVKDMAQREYLLGPNHGEMFMKLIQNEISSYEQLPLNLYQIQTKYRDEQQPRFGLIHSREFITSESYSFHDSDESLEQQYRAYEQAYRSILTRCGLVFKRVLGNSGTIGVDSQEFIAISEIGTETICFSDESDYAANREMATSLYTSKKSHATYLNLEKVSVPENQSIQEVAESLMIETNKMIQSRLFVADNQPILVLLRGDHEINRTKLKNYLGCRVLREGTETESQSLFGVEKAFIGPVNHSEHVAIYADLYVEDLVNSVTGANESYTYFVNVNPNRDFKPKAYADFRLVQEGDPSPDGQGTIVFKQGIEIGNIFKLGLHCSEQLGATVSTEEGQAIPIRMGCYTIGISRFLAAIVEQHSDEQGIAWPKEIAPFDLHILQIDMEDDYQLQLSQEVAETMQQAGYEVLIDDRMEEAEIKFVEADLIGCPIRITIGKKATEGIVEIKIRQTNATLEVRKEELADTLNILLTAE
ncbi:proline--tRNA ligase [Enterococcus saccharolyticus]|uniref:proline--tRNA ligase n=1 Tax=Enterococcus saccharolyticus TaxID=41997 RepID=UPI001E5B1F47|nr:proline--tRNA ligase [Enterococcus saccharolyticus]MCD5001061.1 proline--tRNA ligase [Enterococcus saccharolyticus]